MWGDQQPRKDRSGCSWNFRTWRSFLLIENKQVMAHRLFFWNDNKSSCGVVLFLPGSRSSGRRKQLIEKLVADPTLREKYQRGLRFPLERHYSDYGAFPEEQNGEAIQISK
jgi:hypothetical protein